MWSNPCMYPGSTPEVSARGQRPRSAIEVSDRGQRPRSAQKSAPHSTHPLNSDKIIKKDYGRLFESQRYMNLAHAESRFYKGFIGQYNFSFWCNRLVQLRHSANYHKHPTINTYTSQKRNLWWVIQILPRSPEYYYRLQVIVVTLPLLIQWGCRGRGSPVTGLQTGFPVTNGQKTMRVS